MNRFKTLGFAIILSAAVAGCGGGAGGAGSGSTGTGTPPPVSGTVSGTVVKGPVSGASVTAYGVTNGAMGARVASTTTDAEGRFSLAMGAHSGPVMLQVTGGQYTDEASGSTMTMLGGDTMSAILPTMAAGAGVSGIQVTPLTSMAQAMALRLSGGMTDANIAAANSAVGDLYMVVDILQTAPMNPLLPGAASAATQDAMNYGMTLAAMSQLARTQGMNSSSAVVTALMNDAADGVMDGRMSGNPVMMGGMAGGTMMPVSAGTSGLATAMAAFMASGQNRAGVSSVSMLQLMNRLTRSNGQLMGAGGGSMVNGTMSGRVFNGAFGQATVTAHGVTSGTRGAQIASTATDLQGNFTLSLGGYSGPLMLQVSHGAYADEATGLTMYMDAEVMTAAMTTIASGATVGGVWVTPMTAMAQARAQAMTGGMTDANIAAANAAVGNYFMIDDILRAACMDPAAAGSGGGTTQDQRNCGAAVAAMSQYARALGMSSSMRFVTSLMQDASDGTMNGMLGSSQIAMGGMMSGGMGGGMMQANAGTSGLAGAMTDFMESAMNRSGLTAADMNVLIQRLASSSGSL